MFCTAPLWQLSFPWAPLKLRLNRIIPHNQIWLMLLSRLTSSEVSSRTRNDMHGTIRIKKQWQNGYKRKRRDSFPMIEQTGSGTLQASKSVVSLFLTHCSDWWLLVPISSNQRLFTDVLNTKIQLSRQIWMKSKLSYFQFLNFLLSFIFLLLFPPYHHILEANVVINYIYVVTPVYMTVPNCQTWLDQVDYPDDLR